MSQPLRVAGFQVIISGRFWVITKAPCLARLTEIYRESWREVLTGAQIECALAQVPPIAIVLYLFERWNWLASERRHDPQFQSYLRGLARQMDRAAQALELGSVLCA